MGPITLFDKSFLQSLSFDEAVWFDTFFLTNIPPVFFVETLADLEKAVRSGKTPESEVGLIASKTPEVHSQPNQFHHELCMASLCGYKVPMNGQIVLAGGKVVKTADQSGVIFDVPPEAEALSRWQSGDFLEVERHHAKIWRKMIGSLNFDETIKKLNNMGINPNNVKTLEGAKAIAEGFTSLRGYSSERLIFVFDLLNLPSNLFPRVWARLSLAGFPDLDSFSPYASFVIKTEIFFYVAAAANLFSTKKVTNKIDLTYMFYLPFSMLFVSSDNFHRRCAPLFMTSDQTFVWGPDLKNDLRRINTHYESLPEDEKEKGLFAIASCPPKNMDLLTASLWDKHLPRWRTVLSDEPKPPIGKSEGLLGRLKEIANAPELQANQIDFDLTDPDAMILKRKIRRKRGKWWQIPKGLEIEEESKG